LSAKGTNEKLLSLIGFVPYKVRTETWYTQLESESAVGLELRSWISNAKSTSDKIQFSAADNATDAVATDTPPPGRVSGSNNTTKRRSSMWRCYAAPLTYLATVGAMIRSHAVTHPDLEHVLRTLPHLSKIIHHGAAEARVPTPMPYCPPSREAVRAEQRNNTSRGSAASLDSDADSADTNLGGCRSPAADKLPASRQPAARGYAITAKPKAPPGKAWSSNRRAIFADLAQAQPGHDEAQTSALPSTSLWGRARPRKVRTTQSPSSSPRSSLSV